MDTTYAKLDHYSILTLLQQVLCLLYLSKLCHRVYIDTTYLGQPILYTPFVVIIYFTTSAILVLSLCNYKILFLLKL